MVGITHQKKRIEMCIVAIINNNNNMHLADFLSALRWA